MSKRQASPNKTPNAKRARQQKLDTFFTSPSKGATKASASANRAPVATETIDVDALDDIISPAQARGPSLEPLRNEVTAGGSNPSLAKSAIAFGTNRAEAVQLKFLPVDLDPPFYEPRSQPWLTGSAPYAFLAHAFVTLSQTRSRTAILNTLTNTLRTILARHPASLVPSLYLLSNSLSPQYVGTELGIGAAVISKAIQQVSGLSAAALKHLYNRTGDPGDLAFQAKSNVRTLIPHPPLTIKQVYNSLLKIAACKGQGASKDKGKIVEKLLVAGAGEEVRYLVRTLTLNLRVGAVRTSILTALARAFVLHGAQSSSGTSSDLYASQDLLKKIQAEESDSRKKASDDTAREHLKALFENAEGVLKKVYARHPCYDDIVNALLEDGFAKLSERIPLTVGIPLLPTLGSPTRSLDEIYERIGDLSFVAEFKYDGQRAQIHARAEPNGKVSVKIFSRHLEDMTTKYPDVILLVEHMFKRQPSLTSFILDSEIVAVDPGTGELKSFQELAGRARKNVQLSDVKVVVAVYAFDIMYLNGESYLEKSFRERRSTLLSRLPVYLPEGGSLVARFCHVESCESDRDRSAIVEFWQRAVDSRCEGLMVKVLDYDVSETKESGKGKGRAKKLLPATYEPDKRTSAWLKLKKDYLNDLGDSLDLIPIGAWHGNGRKVGWWSPILMGLWNPETGRPVAVCKCMSGFTDNFYKALLDKYPAESSTCSTEPKWECDFGGFRPDVFFKPTEVWELRGADITESPVSIAARSFLSGTRGLSVRFPRFIQERKDKGVEDGSTPEFLAGIWRRQQKKPSASCADDGDLIDIDMEGSLEGSGAECEEESE